MEEREDTISRQAAIDALHTWFRDGFDEDKWWNSTHVLAAIEGLPSVQQEHKWETCFECPLSHGCPKIKDCTNEQAIEYASQIPNDCPLSAQLESEERTAESAQNVPNDDLISRKMAIEELRVEFKRIPTTAIRAMEVLKGLPSAQPESSFVTWLLDEIWDEDMWELNWQAFPELLCRKLTKLGYIKEKDGEYERLDKQTGGD